MGRILATWDCEAGTPIELQTGKATPSTVFSVDLSSISTSDEEYESGKTSVRTFPRVFGANVINPGQ